MTRPKYATSVAEPSRLPPQSLLLAMRLGTAASVGRTQRRTAAFALGTSTPWAADEKTARDEQRKRSGRPLLSHETGCLRRATRPRLTAPPNRLQAAGRFRLILREASQRAGRAIPRICGVGAAAVAATDGTPMATALVPCCRWERERASPLWRRSSRAMGLSERRLHSQTKAAVTRPARWAPHVSLAIVRGAVPETTASKAKATARPPAPLWRLEARRGRVPTDAVETVDE
jgi:hypothetical protein